MDQIRFSKLPSYMTTSHASDSLLAGMETDASPTNPTANQGVDEFVYNPSRGTFASLQDSPSLSVLMSGTKGDHACSFVF